MSRLYGIRCLLIVDKLRHYLLSTALKSYLSYTTYTHRTPLRP